MNKIKSVALFFALGLLFAQCASNKKTSSSSSSANTIDEEKIVAKLKDKYTPEQISEGKVLYESSCKKCHDLHAPDSRTVFSWLNILPTMTVRTALEKAEVNKVRAYLLTHAKEKA